MLDAHCHLDRYESPKDVANQAALRGVFTVAVTNLPSHWQAGLPHVRSLSQVRLALGLHPLAAVHHEHEREIFRELLRLTSFVGEVGLDFSNQWKGTREVQIASFRFVAQCIASGRKFVSLHSREADSAVLDILTEFRIPVVVFHWYSGSLRMLDEILSRGHYFSVNPSMMHSEKGQRIIERIPPERILTETDGPHVKVGRHSARPWDVSLIEDHLARLWTIHPDEARKRIWSNFRQILHELGLIGVT
jgi:TatD DNase family protein